MSVYVLVVDPTAADLALASRVAAQGAAWGKPVMVQRIAAHEGDPCRAAFAPVMFGTLLELDRTTVRKPRPKRRIPAGERRRAKANGEA